MDWHLLPIDSGGTVDVQCRPTNRIVTLRCENGGFVGDPEELCKGVNAMRIASISSIIIDVYESSQETVQS